MNIDLPEIIPHNCKVCGEFNILGLEELKIRDASISTMKKIATTRYEGNCNCGKRLIVERRDFV